MLADPAVPDSRGTLLCTHQSQVLFTAAVFNGGAFPLSADPVHHERLPQLPGGYPVLAGVDGDPGVKR